VGYNLASKTLLPSRNFERITLSRMGKAHKINSKLRYEIKHKETKAHSIRIFTRRRVSLRLNRRWRCPVSIL